MMPITWRRARNSRRRSKSDQQVASQCGDKTTSARSAELISPSTAFNEKLTDGKLTEDVDSTKN